MEAEDPSLSELLTDAIGLVTRRRWWIMISAFCVTVIGIVVLMALPDKYTSEATLVVVQQRIAQRYVEPASVAGATELFYAMTREILSRDNLMTIIDDFNLYPEERAAKVGPDKLTAKMQKDLDVSPQDFTVNREMISFKIAFSSTSPELARDVTGRLATIFVEENLRRRSGQALTTTRFLADQIEAAKLRLSQSEQKVKDFKIQYLDQLPQQEQANLGQITDLRIQLQGVLANKTRTSQQRLSFESILNGHLARLRADRDTLLTRFTPKHPEVVKKSTEIAKAEALVTRLRSPETTNEVDSPLIGQDDPVIAQVRGQLDANLAEADSLTREEQRLRAEITRYQARLKLTPVREQELTDIVRDYELYKKDYNELLAKQLNAQLSSTLEERQEGQQFRLVDAPSLPTAPSSPKRLKLSAGALAGGFVLGLGLAFLMEAKNRSFHSLKEVRQSLALPFVVGVPVLSTPSEIKHQRVIRGIEWAVASVMAVGLSGMLYYVYRNG